MKKIKNIFGLSEDKPKTISILADGNNFKGDFTCQGPSQIDGTIEGTITSKDSVIIGETAVIDGVIKVNDITVFGKVFGSIEADKVEITETGVVTGKISTRILIVKEGSLFNGECVMKKTPGPTLHDEVAADFQTQTAIEEHLN